MDTHTYSTFQRIMRGARAVMGLEQRRADPGAFTAYVHLACAKAQADIAEQGYCGVEVESDWTHGEMVAIVHGTPAVAVSL